MDESKRQFILNRMKGLQKDVEAGRRVRTENAAAQAPVRKQPGFSDLPEYKQVVMQQLAGQQMGMENPFYRAHEGASGATALIGGRSFDNFASYDYLGLNHHPKVLSRASEALQTFGVSASASRVVAGERTIHTVLEEKIADVYDAQAAVCFVSGYLTNVAGISSLVGPKDLVIHDEFIHNSALAGIKLSGATRRFFKHNDTADLDRVLKTLAGDYERILVIVEGVYSMDGDIADLPALLRLKEQYGFWLMVDEAHSLGVLGETGRGVFEHFGIAAGEVDIWMGTLSKTSCSCGGYIAGSEALVTLLKAQAGGFVYSVGLAPALAAAAIASLEILKAEPERTHQLRHNSRLFLDLARERGLDTGLSQGYSVVPVLVADSLRAVQLSNELHADGINVLPIIHPAVPEGLARLRFFITSAHTDEQIARAVDRTAAILGRLEQEKFGLGSFDARQLMALFAKS